MTTRKSALFMLPALLIIILAGLLGWVIAAGRLSPPAAPAKFDGKRAYRDVQAQVTLGPRTPRSAAHAQVLEWMRTELEAAGWQVEIQQAENMGHPIQNLTARRGKQPPQILLGAHYDSRLYADQDPDPAKQNQGVPGANDGASGVAVLLELARVLPEDALVWLIFFDAEDNGNIPGWDWILGSRAYMETLTARPQAMVLVDMVGDADLRLPLEKNSDPALRQEIWAQAAVLGHADVFVAEEGQSIQDDHLPFLEAGIPAVDIIDLQYPYWHTTADTPDKVSADSLQAVGDTLQAWIMERTKEQEILEEVKYNKTQANVIREAVEAYYNSRGHYPEHLNELAPEYLDEVPFTKGGEPFDYGVGSYCIYSLSFEYPGMERLGGYCGYCKKELRWECGLVAP